MASMYGWKYGISRPVKQGLSVYVIVALFVLQWFSVHIHRAEAHFGDDAHFHVAQGHVHQHGLHDRLETPSHHVSDAGFVEVGDELAFNAAKVLGNISLACSSSSQFTLARKPVSRLHAAECERNEFGYLHYSTVYLRGPPASLHA